MTSNEKIRSFLKNKIDQGLFTGCSLIFGQPQKKWIEIHEGTLGKHLSTRTTGETQFDLQSITKAAVTAPLFAKLIETGKLSAEDKIGPALNQLGVCNPEMAEITFLDLLTHTSGLSDVDLVGDFESPQNLWDHMFAAKPHFYPGTNIEYSDLGYRILGRLIECELETDLEKAALDFLWRPLALTKTTYRPKDLPQVAATPDVHGIIDDEQVHFLGDVLGSDGLFSTANDLFHLMSSLLENETFLLNFLKSTKRDFGNPCTSFFDALTKGPKCAGWEMNPTEFSYAGSFRSELTYEKAGGAGTFIWLDAESKYIFVYLTNFGKPKPFDDQSWNHLLASVAPHRVSDLIYDCLNEKGG